jgi:hypothetical protein
MLAGLLADEGRDRSGSGSLPLSCRCGAGLGPPRVSFPELLCRFLEATLMVNR